MTTSYASHALATADDRTLAGRAGDGDVAAFEVLVRRYTPLMTGYVRRLLGDDSDVDDIVQDAWIVAWDRWSDLQDHTHVKSWLMTIVSRRAIDRTRSRRPADELPEDHALPASAAAPDHEAEVHSERNALRAVLAELPELQRQTWLLREAAGLSYDDIAAELGIQLTTVRGLLARARKHVFVRMEAWR